MKMEINRLICEQMPGVAILGTGGRKTGTRREHLVHAHQFVGLLKGNMDRRSSSKAFHAFLESDDGKNIRENDGGDLLTAIQRGPIGSQKMMYTHRLQPSGRGSPSVFVTLNGVKEIMNKLPNADETVKNRLKEIFSGYLNPYSPGGFLSFVEATPEQCAQDGLDEMVTDTDDTSGGNQLSGENSGSNAALIPQYMWHELYESSAAQRVLKAQLEAKDSFIAANEMVKVAEIEKERATSSARAMEVEMAKKELSHFKESAAKDLQIAKLQMKLELAEAKEKLRAEFEKERPERGEHRDKMQRVAGLLKMHTRDTVFSKLVSVFWSNNNNNGDVGVNTFTRLTIRSNGSGSREPITVMPKLSVNCEIEAGENFLHRSFGFCFQGKAISEEALQRSKHIKEAYGVKDDDGIHYVCVVLFKRFGVQLSKAPTLPYALGLLPCTVVADKIQGRDYRLAVYKAGLETDDPVLAMVKRPSPDKWFWHSTAAQ